MYILFQLYCEDWYCKPSKVHFKQLVQNQTKTNALRLYTNILLKENDSFQWTRPLQQGVWNDELTYYTNVEENV